MERSNYPEPARQAHHRDFLGRIVLFARNLVCQYSGVDAGKFPDGEGPLVEGVVMAGPRYALTAGYQ